MHANLPPRNWKLSLRSIGLILLRALTPALRSSLERVLETQNGGDLSLEESYALANAEGDDLLGLLVAANLLRAELVRQHRHLRGQPQYQFHQYLFRGMQVLRLQPRPARSRLLLPHPRAIWRAKAVEAWELGATEVCIQGGLPRDLPKFYYRDILRAVKNAVPRMHIHAFSPMEIVYGVELTGMPLADYLSMLRDNGLGTLPGTAAEILDDEIRHILSRQQTFHRAMDRSHPHRASLRHSHHIDADVRTRRNAGTLGAPDAAAARHSSRNRRLHRIRSAGLRTSEHIAVSSGPGAHRARLSPNI